MKFLSRLFLLFPFAACSERATAVAIETTEACSAISAACHDYGRGTGTAHECHELGHAGPENACSERKAACLSACPTKEYADGGLALTADSAANEPVVSTEPGCIAYCGCLDTTCREVEYYPYPDVSACLRACSTLSNEAKTCLPKWCAKAQASPSPAHSCEHAWGKLGTVECASL